MEILVMIIFLSFYELPLSSPLVEPIPITGTTTQVRQRVGSASICGCPGTGMTSRLDRAALYRRARQTSMIRIHSTKMLPKEVQFTPLTFSFDLTRLENDGSSEYDKSFDSNAKNIKKFPQKDLDVFERRSRSFSKWSVSFSTRCRE